MTWMTVMMRMKKRAARGGEAQMASEGAHRARSGARRANGHSVAPANPGNSRLYERLGPGIHLAYALHILDA